MPKIVVAILVLSMLFFYLFKSEIQNNMMLIAWVVIINIINFILIYDYLHYKLFYQKRSEEKYRKAKKRLKLKERKLKLLLSQAPDRHFLL